MLYFKSRAQAGELLAEQLVPKYQSKDCAVICLSDGGVVVGAQIALRLHCVMTMLLTAPIVLPRENDAMASVNQEGTMAYNDMYSPGEIEYMESEYRNYIEQQRQQKMHDMNVVVAGGGLIRKDLLLKRHVILVSDGLGSSFPLDAAADFLKPLQVESVIVATPLASVPAVDRMHILADDVYCLNVIEDFFTTDHYYESQDAPDHDTAIKTIKNIVQHWK